MKERTKELKPWHWDDRMWREATDVELAKWWDYGMREDMILMPWFINLLHELNARRVCPWSVAIGDE